MGEGSVPRGVLNPPRLGPFRVPLDLIPLFSVLGMGVITGMPLWFSGGATVLAGIATVYLRRFGNGFLRGVVLYWTSGHLHLPGTDPSRRTGKRSIPR
ncbi:MAG: hypothetical protein ACYC9S_05645 [Leptospirales bacterium]